MSLLESSLEIPHSREIVYRNDYTPEEVEEVKRAHPWIYDKNAK
jgi:hypothetical protein